MRSRTLQITWKPDPLHMIEHDGSFEWKEIRPGYHYGSDTNHKGRTSRPERETFRNVKTVEAANKILSRKNRKDILFASYINESFMVPVILFSSTGKMKNKHLN